MHIPRFCRLILILVALALFIVAAFFTAHYVEESTQAQQLVEQFGYLGIILLAAIAGVNVIVPIPAATLTPVFLAAGLELPLIILALIIGTTFADLVSYLIGRYGRDFSAEHYPRFYERLEVANDRYRPFVLPGMFIYAAFVPFPNEAMLIPLGLLGFRFQYLLIPLVLGTAVNQTILALGFTSAFDLFF